MHTAGSVLPPPPSFSGAGSIQYLPPHYDPLNVQVGLFVLGSAICALAVLVIFGNRSKSERTGYLLFLCGAFATIQYDAGWPTVFLSYGVGLLFASFASAPFWLWRALGNKAGAFMAGAVSIIAMILACLAIPKHSPIIEAKRFIEAGAALLAFTWADQGWTMRVNGHVIRGPFFLLSAVILLSLKSAGGILVLMGVAVAILGAVRLVGEISDYINGRRFRENAWPQQPNATAD